MENLVCANPALVVAVAGAASLRPSARGRASLASCRVEIGFEDIKVVCGAKAKGKRAQLYEGAGSIDAEGGVLGVYSWSTCCKGWTLRLHTGGCGWVTCHSEYCYRW